MSIQKTLLKLWGKLRIPTYLQLFVMRRVNDQFLIGVTGIIFDTRNRILLVNHTYRGNNAWSLPGGYVKGQEHPKEGLEREINEETGLIVSVDIRIKIRTDRNSPRLDITYAGNLIGGERKLSSEIKRAKFFSFDHLPDIPHDQLMFINEALKIRDQITTQVLQNKQK